MNNLTERLLQQGYTKKYHPSNVEWTGWQHFEFTYQYLCSTVWETPCGLLEKGSRFGTGSTSHGGIDYMPENNNPLGGCPYYGERECPRLLDKKFFGENCIYHYTERPYNYENSVHKLWDAWNQTMYEARQKVTDGYGHCECFRWDLPTRSYQPDYWVERCINSDCRNEVCAITKQTRNLERVNIFYDLHRTYRYKIGFAEFIDQSITKGERQFKKSIARTDAEIWLKTYGEKGLKAIKMREDRTNSHFSEHHGAQGFGEYEYYHFSSEPQNIRIERRESRDLMQDLQDVAEGIRVVHASDLKKEAAAAKRRRKEERQKAKQRKNERNMIQKWQTILATRTMPDGSPCSEVMLDSCKAELKKRGLLDVCQQLTLWEDSDAKNEPGNPGRLPSASTEFENHVVHDKHSFLDTAI